MDHKEPFESVVQRHGSTVLRVCRMVVGHNEAEDVWSETFISALRAYPSLAADANIEAWLVTIAHHKAIDLLRARNRRAMSSGVLPEQQSTLGLPGENHSELLSAVANLPAKQRQAVAYHYLVGLPYQQIAEILGGTAEAARRAASDGLKRLRSQNIDGV